jgi:hypothetical protein
MSYTINYYNGDFAVTVQDGTVDSTFAVKLIGKNYAGYGEVHNENFLALLQNFAGNNEPGRKTAGQLWYDSQKKKLKFYDGGKFKNTGGAEISDTEPLGLVEGDLWYKPATKQLFAKTSLSGADAFSLIGPQAAGSAQTEMFSRTVTDTFSGTHSIIEAIVNGQTMFIISQDGTFTLDDAENGGPIAGFTDIHPGITLAYTREQDPNDPMYGVQETTDLGSDPIRFFGTATNADKLGGVLAENYVRNDQASAFTSRVAFADVGYTVGDTEITPFGLLVDIDSGAPRIQSQVNTLKLQTKSGSIKTALVLTGLDTLPANDSVSNLGATSFKFATVYANRFQGIAYQAEELKLGGAFRSASTTALAYSGTPLTETIVARDNKHDIYANVFQGEASSARYADLAEKYLPDADYVVGTVVAVGGEKEVTACKYGDRAIGVVSANPAFMMNKDLEGGVYIALKGRVPVRVVGAVAKGQRLIASSNGCAVGAVPHANDVFAIALETNSDTSEKIVEAIIL